MMRLILFWGAIQFVHPGTPLRKLRGLNPGLGVDMAPRLSECARACPSYAHGRRCIPMCVIWRGLA
jgi:hypothetical protein